MLILRNKKFLLLLILVLAFVLRSYRLDSYPPINPDEAAIAYNAYSLIQTGKDEHGASWPLHFQSFGDFKPGGYFYLAIPFIKLLGLNTLAVRLPNLFLSTSAVILIYLLVKLISSSSDLALLSAFVLSINPWHIHFSRGAWESSAALTFILLGTYFFYKYLKTAVSLHLVLFFIAFVLSLYIYHSARIIAPVLGIFFFLSNFKTLIHRSKQFVFPLIFAFLITLPVLISFVHSGGSARFSGVGLLADSGPYWRANELLGQHSPSLLYRVIHNKVVLYAISWAEKYTSHFSGSFLFINGDDVPRSKVPEMGQLYLVELPFLLLGLFLAFRHNYSPIFKRFLVFWTLITPLASSFTFQAPSALRALPLSISLSIFIAIGLHQLLNSRTIPSKSSIMLLFILLYAFNIFFYLDSYYLHYLKRYPNSWSQSFDQIIPYVTSNSREYANIYFTDKYDQPYILYLFYSHYPPQNLQPQIKLSPPDKFGFSTVRQIDNIHFTSIDWGKIPSNSLVIASTENVPLGPIKVINFSNGEPAFKIYKK
ncbi:phospholipid carrier-dependent glycosyltransferase [Patescibacteria group bacterium]|nr:phospholipid carrier-dependent glycosyltransferase [Patescibacteria group bacterium]